MLPRISLWLIPLILCGPAAFLAEPANPLLSFYQHHISAVDGDRCPMHPTCSEYARQAIETHGVLAGWIMACDRLVRCGRDETRLSPKMVHGNRILTRDPLSANDFWWFQEKKHVPVPEN